MFVERRKAQRIKKSLIVQYQSLNETPYWDVAEAKDFSELGILMMTKEKCEAETRLRLRIRLPSDPFCLHELEGRIVASDNYRARIEITKIKTEARDMMRQYVAWYLGREGPALWR